MTIKQVLHKIYQQLKEAKIDSPELDAEIIIATVLKKPKEFIYAHDDKKLTKNQIKKINSLSAKRAKHYPLAYLTNHKEFYGLDFYVDKNVLIPRPETELLVEEAINYIKHHPNIKTVADIGTGSGCIAIAIKKNLPRVKVYGIDISAPALKVAKKNATHNKVKIVFKKGNILELIQNKFTPSQPSPYKGAGGIQNKKINLIVANLPYLSNETLKKLKPEVQKEPRLALVAGPKKSDEAKIYNELFLQYRKYDMTAPIFLESHPQTDTLIKKAARHYFSKEKIITKKDLSHKPRLIMIES